ncbi:MAG TPA: hypothetical protein PK802_03675 [Candidatus Cloacimonadota bacterium]|nr:hypothetical protein [Candidatus Cloacimonadota bacterium]HOC95438.1 hypothetical protein [Candidatus Cloacimonadota bacterium]HOG31490.1 hypothetical protein [Candidatus Cloacimonadota bacterium]HOR59486.1 hypothetical protein [Candidatus Cloacimonadota bacterium]HPB08772.1 hypothetical protein [Candidatus Cloacimonadota bacterium]
MNFFEMFIAVLAIMLFATIAIVHLRTVEGAADLVTNASHSVQAMQIAQEVLDEIDARMMVPKEAVGLKFNQIDGQYNNLERRYNLEHYGTEFHLIIRVYPCNQYGDTAASSSTLVNKLVVATVQGPAGLKHPVTLSRVYTAYSVEGL